MTSTQKIERYIEKREEGSYFEIPFSVPENVERIDVEYIYLRQSVKQEDNCECTQVINIVDLALSGPGGAYVGASGSDRTHLWVSEYSSAHGYAAVPADAGEWHIIAGAYKIDEGGSKVTFSITCTFKECRLLKGDTHMHTIASDGSMSSRDIAIAARSLGLDYIFITDHNNYADLFYSVDVEGITVLPGTEWTHYKGHCGMLGVRKPYESAFCVNSPREAREKMAEAKENGAVLVLNHPFCPYCGWKWGFDSYPYDLIEIWNGGTAPKSTMDCLSWWQKQLETGKKIPVTGGSDYHRVELMRSIGFPCTCLYAMSRGPSDVMDALKNGNSYITCAPDGPGVSAEAEGKILGETAPRGSLIKANFFGLREADRIRVITDQSQETFDCKTGATGLFLEIPSGEARFCRFEILRSNWGCLPEMVAMISNPIYFE